MTDKAYSDARKAGSFPRSARTQKGSPSTQLAWLFGLLALFVALPAKAQMTITDLQIAARALSFMERPLSATVRMGIVYVPGDAASEAEADSAAQLLGNGLKAGNLLFTPVRVALKDASTAEVDLYFLPDGMGDRSAAVARRSGKKKTGLSDAGHFAGGKRRLCAWGAVQAQGSHLRQPRRCAGHQVVVRDGFSNDG
jgi:hypothetical protein